MDLQELLNKWNIKCDINTLLSMWNESHRSWHTLDHLNDLISQINENKSLYSQKEYEKLLIASLFHDCVYEPMSQDNEEKSADFFVECCADKNSDILEIKQIILDTKTHKSGTKLSEAFNNYDMNIVERDYDQLLKWEIGIKEEFKNVGKEKYKEGRLKFLESILDKYPNNTENLLKLIDYVKNESKMNQPKDDYVKLFTNAIKKSDRAIVFEIENTVGDIDEDVVYFEFEYQIDDRIERMDDEVKSNLERILKNKYSVRVNRNDAFPNGYAAYSVSIYSK